jgi:MFS transporter, OFA family, oxalate/formate antiporter
VRIYPGWRIVAGAFAILFVTYGAQFSFGILFSPLLAESGWTRASISGVFGVYTTVYCVCALPAGRLTDRFGPRLVIAGGGVLLGAALTGLSLTSQLWQVYVLYGLVAGIGMSTAFIPCSATVVRWFVRRRGLAVGVAASGVSAGAMVVPPLAQLIVGAAGWRTAFVMIGLVILVLLNVLGPIMRRDPESVGLRPDGASGPLDHATGAEDAESWPLARALRSLTFWVLGSLFNLTWFSIFIPTVHLAALAEDRGFSPMIGASALSVLGCGALLGRLVSGELADRVGRKTALATSVTAESLALLGFVVLDGLPMFMISAFVFGAAYAGTSTLFPVILGDFYGRGHVGSLSGFIFAFSGVFSGLGPFVTGVLRDARGDYGFALVLAALINAAALLLLPWARPPHRAGTSRAARATLHLDP